MPNVYAALDRPHKLRVHDPALAAALVAKGGRLVADYGAFQLIETDDVTSAKTDAAEPADEFDFVELNARQFDTRATEVKALRKAAGAFTGKRLHLVHFAGPIKPEWREALEKHGVQIVAYVPQNAYLVHGNAAALGKMQAWAGTSEFVQWEGDYADDYKIHPRARLTDEKGRTQTPATDTFAVQLVDAADENPATLALIDSLKLAPVKKQFRTLGYLNVIVRLPVERLSDIAKRPEVVSIQPYFERRKLDERQDQILAGNLSGNSPSEPGYLAWLTGKGFTQTQFDTSGFVVDVSDSGVDNGTTSPEHFGLFKTGSTNLTSRVVYTRLEGTANPGSTLQGCDGHGNLNGHIISGYDDLAGFPFADGSGYHYGLGVCPFVKIGSAVIFDPDYFTTPTYDDLISRAYRDGARISNNSWGSTGDGSYDVDAQNYDALVRDAQPGGSAVPNPGNQEMVIVFAAGNDGPSATTIGPPGSGKNIISVGAAENVQAFGGSDGSGVSDSDADSANDIVDFSSRGPCTDGRTKPDLCAPGTHVSGGVAQAASPGATGTAIDCYDGSGVSGGVNSIYFPAGQQFYTASSGTSHSTPAVAGSCALVRQYFINHFTNPPSPAMTKAFLMNSARYMTGTYANDTLPSDNQGMGAVNLGMAFDGATRALRDQLSADLMTGTGQTRSFSGIISDSSKPFRVTVAWTDAPGTTTGNAYNNDLDLTMVVNGNTYKGNVFSGASSTTGGTADGKNNVESVFLPAGVSGNFVVTVTAANINSDGVPGDGTALDQDFALVIYNGVVAAAPSIVSDISTLTAEGCAPTNNAVDPGETVTLSLALKNKGTAGTTNLVATLLATNGVSAPGAAQNYGVLSTNSVAVSRPFTFTANGTCGDAVTATLQLQDGAVNLGTVTFTLPLGQLATISSENFDAVSAPTLPSGWTTATSGAQALWETSTANRDTTPNAAFASESSSAGVSELASPAIVLPASASQLTFRHLYNTEVSSDTSTLGYDGGVLEIKIGAGAFTDIVTAGGSFASGGYNRTLSSSYSNPLAGREAWSGDSGGFVTTTVNLPAAAAGQTVQLQWRCGSDDSIDGLGWHVDSVTIQAQTCCGNVIAPVITSQPQSLTALVGDTVNFGVTAFGTPSPAYQWRFQGTNIAGATTNTYNKVNVQTADAGSYSVTVSNVAGVATSSNAVLSVLTTLPPVIALWDFNSNPADASTATGATTPATGTGTAALVGGNTVTFASGSSGDPASAGTDNSGWNTSSYPGATSANKTAGVQFNVSTLGRQNIVIRWDQRVSNTASKYSRLRYTTNGTTFLDFISPVTMSAAGSFQSKTNDLSGLPGVANNPAFAFRIVSEFAATATGSGGSNYVTASTSSYASGGTVRFDMVTVLGDAIPPSNPPVTLGSLAYATNGQFQFNVTGAAGHSYVVQASSDLSNWTSLATNVSPFTFTDTNASTIPHRFYRTQLLP